MLAVKSAIILRHGRAAQVHILIADAFNDCLTWPCRMKRIIADGMHDES